MAVQLKHVAHRTIVIEYRPVASAGATGVPAPAPEVAAPAPNLSPAPYVAPAVSVFSSAAPSKKIQPPHGRNPGYGAE